MHCILSFSILECVSVCVFFFKGSLILIKYEIFRWNITQIFYVSEVLIRIS